MIEHPDPRRYRWKDGNRQPIKVSPRTTHTLHILFASGENRTYHVFGDNIAVQEKYRPTGYHRIMSGTIYLMSTKLTWTFKHSKGVACIKTDSLAEINVEVGKVDPTKNPLSREENYNDPLN